MNHRPVLFVWALALSFVTSLAQAVTCSANMPSASNPDSAYMDNGDGTVTHTPTGLTWKRCAEGQTWGGGTCSGSASDHTWAQALTQAANSSFAGKTDWRLPDIKELRSLVEECRTIPAINDVIFPNTPSSNFWSGSPNVNGSRYAWLVSFNEGNTDAYSSYRFFSLAVRLVRGGQSFDSLAIAAPVCTLSASQSTIATGSSATLTASCSPTASSYTWTGGACAGTTGYTCTVNPTATTTYTVKGSNAGGTGAAASATVTVSSTSASVSGSVAQTVGADFGGSTYCTYRLPN